MQSPPEPAPGPVGAPDVRSWIGACLRSVARELGRIAIGFGVVDGLAVLALYVLGSYLPIDFPMYLGTTLAAVWLQGSGAPWARALLRYALGLLLLVTATTGGLVPLVPRYSLGGHYLQMGHWIASKFLLAAALPTLVRHVNGTLPGRPWWPERAVGTVAWVLLKGSLWTGAVVAMLVIKGFLIDAHRDLLLAALPFVGAHLALERRRRLASPPAPGHASSGAELLALVRRHRRLAAASAAGAAGVMAITAAAVPSKFAYLDEWRFLQTFDPVESDAPLDLAPSPARSESGRRYREAALAGSDSCGQAPCHPKLYREWRDSPHRHTAGPAYRAALERYVRQEGVEQARRCAGCHDPISLHGGRLDFGERLVGDPGRREGISCLVCHRSFPRGARPADGALELRMPRSYYRAPPFPLTEVIAWQDHRADFRSPAVGDDRLCLACHRFEAVPADGPWHLQPRMIEPCHGDRDCIACHLPRIADPDKPGPQAPIHTFSAEASHRAVELGALEAAGPPPP